VGRTVIGVSPFQFASEHGQTAADPLADHQLRCLQLRGDLGIATLVKHSGADRVRLVAGQPVQQAGQPLIVARQRINPVKLVAVKAHGVSNPDPAPRARLDLSSAHAVGQRVVRDRQHHPAAVGCVGRYLAAACTAAANTSAVRSATTSRSPTRRAK
jgi:hypothetical protein